MAARAELLRHPGRAGELLRQAPEVLPAALSLPFAVPLAGNATHSDEIWTTALTMLTGPVGAPWARALQALKKHNSPTVRAEAERVAKTVT